MVLWMAIPVLQLIMLMDEWIAILDRGGVVIIYCDWQGATQKTHEKKIK